MPQVANTLASLAGSNISNVVVKGRRAAAHARRVLLERNVSSFSLMDLDDPNVAYNYARVPVDHQHPQKVLLFHLQDFQRIVCPDGAAPPGFVGYAANLIHLPHQLLELAFPLSYVNVGSGAAAARPTVNRLTLRQTVLHYVFRDSMVFETGADLEKFKQACLRLVPRFTTRLVALDGASYNLRAGIESHQATPHVPTWTWSMMDRGMFSPAALDAAVRGTMTEIEACRGKAARMLQLDARVKGVDAEQHAAEAELARLSARRANSGLDAAQVQELAKLQANLAKAEEELEQLLRAGQQPGAAPAAGARGGVGPGGVQRGGGGSGGQKHGTSPPSSEPRKRARR
eukprot:352622-Chlamydomonas_euryale.AAC.5